MSVLAQHSTLLEAIYHSFVVSKYFNSLFELLELVFVCSAMSTSMVTRSLFSEAEMKTTEGPGTVQRPSKCVKETELNDLIAIQVVALFFSSWPIST